MYNIFIIMLCKTVLFYYNKVYKNEKTLKNENTFKNEQRSRDAAAKKRANTSGVGKSNNNYEDIFNYTSLQQHLLATPIDSTH